MFGEEEIKKVLGKRADLQQQIDEIDQWLELGKKIVGVLVGTEKPTRGSAKVTPGVTPAKVLIQACAEIVENSNQPIPVTELASAMEAKGYVLGGQVPTRNLSAKLSQAKNLVALRGFGYWPEGKPFGPAGYAPDEDEGRHPMGSMRDFKQKSRLLGGLSDTDVDDLVKSI